MLTEKQALVKQMELKQHSQSPVSPTEELILAERYLTEREERRKAMLHDIAEILEEAFDAHRKIMRDIASQTRKPR